MSFSFPKWPSLPVLCRESSLLPGGLVTVVNSHSGLGLGKTTQSPVGSHEVSGWGAESSAPPALSPSGTVAAGFPTVVLAPAQYAHDGCAVN